MNHSENHSNGPTGDNAPFFFARYPPDTAHWLASVCDEANAKAGENSYEFRKALCELIVMSVRDGLPHALRAVEQLITPNNSSIKHLEERYALLDQARSAVIETGSSGSATQTENPGAPDPATAGGPEQRGGQESDGQSAGAEGGSATSGPTSPGAGTTAGTGTTVTIAGGCGGRATTGQGPTTGIGHQGTLFYVHYSEFRATIPTRRTKARNENKRLIDVRATAERQIAATDRELELLDLVEAADAVLEDLISTHRSESSIAGVLRAAGATSQSLGLTDDAVTWLDTQLKAM
ncbi:hypothetical protein [Streptomyces sp. NPDC029674]|uniref:hypothetical protein n=1 Tax=Streptomyces sp. NPDC029674 TaxID=3365297 RepID=UPI003850C77F